MTVVLLPKSPLGWNWSGALCDTVFWCSTICNALARSILLYVLPADDGGYDDWGGWLGISSNLLNDSLCSGLQPVASAIKGAYGTDGPDGGPVGCVCAAVVLAASYGSAAAPAAGALGPGGAGMVKLVRLSGQ